jgi:phosphomannomutase
MVTGSHIPSDRNGIKFYKRAGEILKADEDLIKENVESVRKEIYGQQAEDASFSSKGQLKNTDKLPEISAVAEQEYISRYIDFFEPNCLRGKKIVVYQHSAVGRDIMVKILNELGAEAVPVERSETFIPIDSENVTEEYKQKFKELATSNQGLFAIVSTDGDSDRPFVIDETGVFYRGDILGCVVAGFLKAKFIAVPISSNDAVDIFCKENDIELTHTKIGSPYVIAAMNEKLPNEEPVVSWEVNGGFLTGNTIKIGDKILSPLPTRDAVLPILTALISASNNSIGISELFGTLPQRFTGGGLIDGVSLGKIEKFKQVCEQRPEIEAIVQEAFSNLDLGTTQTIDLTDGLRMIFNSGEVVHLRPSGNAPQFRVYTNASTQAQADTLVRNAIAENGYIQTLLSNL